MKRIKENKEYEKKFGKIPSKERKMMFFNKKGKITDMSSKKDNNGKEKAKSEEKKLGKKSDVKTLQKVSRIAETKSPKMQQPKSQPVKSTQAQNPQGTDKPVDIGSFSFKKGSKKT